MTRLRWTGVEARGPVEGEMGRQCGAAEGESRWVWKMELAHLLMGWLGDGRGGEESRGTPGLLA